MERLTYKKSLSRWNEGKYPTKYTSRHTFQEVVARLAAYEDTGLEPEEITTEPYGRVFYCNRKCNLDGDWCAEGPGCRQELNAETAQHLLKLAQAEKDGWLVVLEPVPSVKGAKKPTCFYNDMGQEFCLGFGRGREDDEPIDTCKECWYCEFSLTREEAEAALKKREEADNEAD